MAASSCNTVSFNCCSLAISSDTAFSILLNADALTDAGLMSPVLVAVCGTSTVDDAVVVENLPGIGDSLPVSGTGDLYRKLAGRGSSDVFNSRDSHSTYIATNRNARITLYNAGR